MKPAVMLLALWVASDANKVNFRDAVRGLLRDPGRDEALTCCFPTAAAPTANVHPMCTECAPFLGVSTYPRWASRDIKADLIATYVE